MNCRSCKYLIKSKSNILYCSENHNCTFENCEHYKLDYKQLNKNSILLDCIVSLYALYQELDDYTINDLKQIRVFVKDVEINPVELDKVLKHRNDLSKLDGINKIIPKIQETIKNWERDLQNE